jgi:mRNA interferase MazF
MKRGDLVTIAVTGDYGKPRPALIIQSDSFSQLPSLTVLRLTSDLHDEPTFRVTITPTTENGLKSPSQIMLDKSITIPREKIGKVFGQLDSATMLTVSRGLIDFLGLEGAALTPPP